ncbi:NAD(P)-binding protein [Xylona heveae TC161]|uniref:NAD(P)-binding protein n=1 Tax=Xylona heveae (strain CBS 132557 / TC161) TaxID=1328760 RepID=A0A165I1I0_XYLHT|nr:NAD(P)-binding protein [Xylona heveae TC161]KZF24224.1 NAD(P)-binding protein [Xylona heveae TC161]
MSVAHFFYTQLFSTPPYPEYDFSGQTVIVTGSNTGLGKEAARHIVRLGAEKVILAVRSVERGEDARKSIEETTHRHGVIEVWELDLGNYASVKAFAKRAEGLKRLDVLLENAGIATYNFSMLEGNERTITINVVSTFLLALLMLPKLRETAAKFGTVPRLAVVSSGIHYQAQFKERTAPILFDALNDEKTSNMPDRYPLSKLLEVFAGRELAERMDKSGKPSVVFNLTDPGLCQSELTREGALSVEVLKFFLARTTEAGSRTLVYAASPNAGKETHGEFLDTCKVVCPSKLVTSEEGAEIQKRFWKELSEKLETIQPGVTKNI